MKERKLHNQNISDNDSNKCHKIEKCPIPAAHNRLEEAHRLWHQAAQQYEDPVGFRTNLNACIQALRSVTFVIQKQKTNIPNFDSWYSEWQRKLKADPILNWIVQARNIIVKEGDLETKSIARASVLTSYDDPPYKEFSVSPLMPTMEIAYQLAEEELSEFLKQNGLLKVERLWVADSLPEHELLEALAHAYGVLSILINDAHLQAGIEGTQIYVKTKDDKPEPLEFPTEHLKGRLPCMVASDETRTAWIKLSTKELIKPFIQKSEIATLEEVKERYGPFVEALPKETKRPRNLKELAKIFFEWGKHILEVDGHHISLVVFISPDYSMSFMELRPEDRSEKYLMWSKVAEEIKRNGAKTILAISEAWVAPQDQQFCYRPAEESPNRTEGLHLCAASANGEEFSFVCRFKRIDGRIIFDETNIIEGKNSFFLEPVRRVWGIAEKPQITLRRYKINRNSVCPCRSGKKFKNCCESSFDKNQLKKALSLYKNGNFKEAEKSFRHHLTQYIIWHYEHTIPFILHDPLNASELFKLDIDAMSEIISFIANCLYHQDRNREVDAFLSQTYDIIDDKRFKSNIDALRNYYTSFN